MSRYRKVDQRLWADAKFLGLSDQGKLLWLYLLTGSSTTSLPGVIVSGRAQIAEHLGWEPEAFAEAFGEVFAKGMAKADWKARVVFIPKAVRYAAPESPNVIRSWRPLWDEVPECALKVEAYQALKVFAEALPEGFAKAFREGIADPSPNQEQDQEQDQKKEKCGAFAPEASASPSKGDLPSSFDAVSGPTREGTAKGLSVHRTPTDSSEDPKVSPWAGSVAASDHAVDETDTAGDGSDELDEASDDVSEGETSGPRKPKAERDTPASRVFGAFVECWKRKVGKGAVPVLADKRRKLINARLKEFDEETLVRAARGIWESEWHIANGQVRVDLLFRDADHVERFAAMAPASAVTSDSTTGQADSEEPKSIFDSAYRKLVGQRQIEEATRELMAWKAKH